MKTKLLLLFLVISTSSIAQITPGLLHEFKFNNSYSNEANTSTFASGTGITFVTDRNGVTNSAIKIANTSTTASVSGLPYGNLIPRTVSFWAKFISLTTGDSNVYSYGASNAYNTGVVTSGAIAALGPGGNHAITLTNSTGTWNLFTFVFDGTNSIIYKDGNQLGVLARNWNVTNNSNIFRLGANQNGSASLNAEIDDLQIYNRALSPSEVLLLFTGKQTIAEYNFDNTYNNVNGTNPFSSNAATSFVADRNGTADNAININQTNISAIIPNLPYGNNAPRSVSLWLKNNSFQSGNNNEVFRYGSSPYMINGYVNSGAVIQSGAGGIHSVGLVTAANSWNYFVFVFDGVNSKIYKDGVLSNTLARNWRVDNNGDVFTLGTTFGVTSFSAAIDDLKIYNYELSQADITSLFTNNTLTSQNFNQNNLEVSVYPNPAKDVLNIEMTNEVKSVEIYNFQGQKVLESNQKQINVSNLSSGMYMIKVQDSENSVATKKVILK
jgi:hypothetical protein